MASCLQHIKGEMMKKVGVLLTLIFIISMANTQAQGLIWGDTTVVKTLFEQEREAEMTIVEGTFIPNIQGYACAVPAINLPNHMTWNIALRHNPHGFMVKNIALAVTDPNMQFCAWSDQQTVFGPQFKNGNKIKMNLKIVRELVEIDNGQTIQQAVRETVSSEVNGRALSSVAMLGLGEL